MSDPATTTEAPPSKEVAVRKGPSVPVKAGHIPRGIIPQTLAETAKLAQVIWESELAPKDLDTVQKVAVAIMTGLEIGLPPMQAMKSIAVINGRPCIWGDAGIALISNSGLMTKRKEEFIGTEGQDDFAAHIFLKRKGGNTADVTFSVADAKKAKLWGKTGSSGKETPWVTYPKRMLMWRARGFAFRDLFADVLMGLRFAEEQRDDDPALDAFTVPRSGLAQRLPGPSSNGFSADHVDGEMNGETRTVPVEVSEAIAEAQDDAAITFFDNLTKALAEATVPLEVQAVSVEFNGWIEHLTDPDLKQQASDMIQKRLAETTEASRKAKK